MDKKLDLYYTKFKEACNNRPSDRSRLQCEDNWLNSSLDSLLSLDFRVAQLSSLESYQVGIVQGLCLRNPIK